MPLTLVEVRDDLKHLKRGLREMDVPNKLVLAVETRALRSGRRQTGQYQSNRQSRWKLQTNDPQFGTELDSKIILVKLLSQLVEFQDAPPITGKVGRVARKYLERSPRPGQYRDPLTKERLSYSQMVAENAAPRQGISSFHIGHDDPTTQPRHIPGNVNTHRKSTGGRHSDEFHVYRQVHPLKPSQRRNIIAQAQ